MGAYVLIIAAPPTAVIANIAINNATTIGVVVLIRSSTQVNYAA
jgi:hypothetical protein